MSQEEADQFYLSDAQHFINKVERHVPDPDALVEALEMVRLMFADCEDADTGKLLFCEETHAAFDKLLEEGVLVGQARRVVLLPRRRQERQGRPAALPAGHLADRGAALPPPAAPPRRPQHW